MIYYSIMEESHNDGNEISRIPRLLQEIPKPPKRLYVRGKLPEDHMVCLTVVGSRRFTRYGKEACEHLIRGLAGYPIVIVSGLALGIDTIAHETALAVGLKTIAFPGSGLSDAVLYPASNVSLAKRIVESGGALVSEFPPDFEATNWSFPQRNRLMAGIAKAILVIEAEEISGTRITAKLALDYNREVLAVPGSIFSTASGGTNALLREGAFPARNVADVLDVLGLTSVKQSSFDMYTDCSDEEKQVLELLSEPKVRGDLLRALEMPTHKANVLISSMELKGLIVETMGELRRG